MSKMTVKDKKEYLMKLVNLGEEQSYEQSIVDGILDEHMKCIPHRKLYKFRECSEQSFKALEQNSIWMSPATSFNDSFDSIINIDLKKNQKELEKWLHNNVMHYIFEFVKQQYEKAGKDFPYTFSDFEEYDKTCFTRNGEIKKEAEIKYLKSHSSADELNRFDEIVGQLYALRAQMEERWEPLAESLLDAINQTRNSFRENMLIYCMTERFDNHSLWENYAENYTGFCIEYNFSDFNKAPFDVYRNLLYLMPMTYRVHTPYFDLVPFLDKAAREHILKESVPENPEMQADLNMQLYYKNKDYDFEHEWRFAIKNKNNYSQNFPFVSAIYAGKDITQENLKRLIEIARSLNVPLYKQEINRAKNGFEYIPVEEVQ